MRAHCISGTWIRVKPLSVPESPPPAHYGTVVVARLRYRTPKYSLHIIFACTEVVLFFGLGLFLATTHTALPCITRPHPPNKTAVPRSRPRRGPRWRAEQILRLPLCGGRSSRPGPTRTSCHATCALLPDAVPGNRGDCSVRDSAGWWLGLVAVTQPHLQLLRECNSCQPCSGRQYEY